MKTWTQQEREEAAGLLFDRMMKDIRFIAHGRREHWIRELPNNAPAYFHADFVIDLQCELTASLKSS